MKRIAVRPVVISAFLFIAGGISAFAQGAFKIPFKFEAGGRKFPAGEYLIGIRDDGQILIRQESKGLEVAIPSLQKLARPEPPVAEPQLVFDAVGNFEPSYTEYVTDYVLSEVWLPGQDGLLVRTLKGAHQHLTLKGRGS